MVGTVTRASRIGSMVLAAAAFALLSAPVHAEPAGHPVQLAMASPPSGGDPVAGAKIFMRCALCHNAEKGGGNGLGPNLFGVVGRHSASLPNFPYSTALKNSGIVWTDDKLEAWVSGPSKVVPGTRMVFPGLSSKKDAADVIAYLHTKK